MQFLLFANCNQAQEILGISPVKFFKAQEVTYQLIRGHQTDYHIGLFSLPYSLMSLHLKLNALYLKMRTLIVNLFYLELIFQSGSTITVLDIPYHFGLVQDFQNLLSVLLLDRRHWEVDLFVKFTLKSMAAKKASMFFLAKKFVIICGYFRNLIRNCKSNWMMQIHLNRITLRLCVILILLMEVKVFRRS